MSDPPAVGTQVEVRGLKSRPDLNGKRGWVTGYDEDADRVEVSFDGPSRDKIKVKPPNAVPIKDLQSASDGLVIGATVEIVGLKSRADLNGRRASIITRDYAAGRIEVQLDGLAGTDRERVKVKPENARLAKDGLAIGVQVEIVDLQSRSDLNGRRGMIVAREPAFDFLGNDRLEVHLDGLNGGERIKCKPANAKLVSSKQLDLSAAVEMAAAAARMKAKGRPQDSSMGEEPEKKFQEKVPDRAQDSSRGSFDRPQDSSRGSFDRPQDSSRGSFDRPQDSSRGSFDRPQDSSRGSFDRPQDSSRGSFDRPQDSSRGSFDRPQDSSRGSFERNSSWRDTDRNRDWDRERDQGRQQDRKTERSRSRPRSGTGPPAFIPGGPNNVTLRNGTVEDRNRDWVCKCGERNFAKRTECYACKSPRTTDAPSYRDVSHMLEQQRKVVQEHKVNPRPMGGGHGEWTTAKDLLGQEDWDALRKNIDERHRQRSESSSSSSSTSSSEASDKKRKKKRGKRSRSSSRSAEKSSAQEASSVAKPNPELDKMKNEALQRLLQIRDEPPEIRKKSWRALLLEWHPDKHSDGRENATAVFQFLQKGKNLLDLKSSS